MSKRGSSLIGSKSPVFLNLEDARPRRIAVSQILYGSVSELILGVVLTFNFAILVIDTDKRANGEKTPLWMDISSDLCSVVYLIEFLARVYVEQRMVLRNPWNRLDLMVLVLTIFEKVLSTLTELDPTSLLLVRAVRIVRLFRLMRALKLLTALRELRKLVQMILTCVRTLFWSCFLTFVLMSIWSVILVELVSPIVKRLEDKHGIWGGDTDWTDSYSTVMRANLTLFQTIVAGDSWGKVPIPVIAEAPWAALVFLPAHVTLVFGVLNLILAVIVDTFAEVRATDHAARTVELEEEEFKEKQALNKIFESIDEDQSGSVTLEELEQGAVENIDFRQRLRVMDVSKADLQQLFEILDEDGSGDVDPEEFIDTLYRLKCADSRSATVMVKHTVSGIMKRQDRFEEQMTQLRLLIDGLCTSQQTRKADDTSGEHHGDHPGDDPPPPFGEGFWEPLGRQSTTDIITPEHSPRVGTLDAPELPRLTLAVVSSYGSPRSPPSGSPPYSPRELPRQSHTPFFGHAAKMATQQGEGSPSTHRRRLQGLVLPRGANGGPARALLFDTDLPEWRPDLTSLAQRVSQLPTGIRDPSHLLQQEWV